MPRVTPPSPRSGFIEPCLPPSAARPFRKQYEPDANHPHEQLPFGGLGDGSAAPCDGVQNEPEEISRAGHEPPGPGGFGTGSVSAVVVTSAGMRERAVLIGSISV